MLDMPSTPTQAPACSVILNGSYSCTPSFIKSASSNIFLLLNSRQITIKTIAPLLHVVPTLLSSPDAISPHNQTNIMYSVQRYTQSASLSQMLDISSTPMLDVTAPQLSNTQALLPSTVEFHANPVSLKRHSITPPCSFRLIGQPCNNSSPRLRSFPVNLALSIYGLSSSSPTTLDAPATTMLDMPAPPKLDVPAPTMRDQPAPLTPISKDTAVLLTPFFIASVHSKPHDPGPPAVAALLLNPCLIASGHPSPQDPGPSAIVADYSVASFTHRAFSTIAIYVLIDFLRTPPRSPSM